MLRFDRRSNVEPLNRCLEILVQPRVGCQKFETGSLARAYNHEPSQGRLLLAIHGEPDLDLGKARKIAVGARFNQTP